MNVVYVSNENYVRHMAASMVSLFEKNRGARRLIVYVFSTGITEESHRLLDEMAGGYGREICWMELGDIREKFDFGINTRGFDVSTMGRLFVGTILPETVERVLYLDCDTIVARPLGKLWKTDLQGNVLGAVMEPTIYDAVRQEIGLEKDEAYANAGVLLIDLRRWRSSEAERRMMDFYREKGGSLFACDQDIINGVLKKEILFLSPEYNFFTNYRYFSYEELVRCSKPYRSVDRKTFQTAKHHPAIIHYAGDERPWIAGNQNHYRKAYENALVLTPWAGTPREKGKEWYMLAYHGMDYMTVLCPAARRAISRRFGMQMVDARKKEAGAKTTAETGQDSRRDSGSDSATDSCKIPERFSGERIDVLLAAYQGETYLEEQLDSILAQSVPGIRIIISDDGSKDRTREILEAYHSRYPDRIFLRHHIKEGAYRNRDQRVPAPAMNFFWLLSQTEADYVLFSDQDDVWEPRKAEKLLRQMKQVEAEAGGGPVLVHSDMRVVDQELKEISPSFFAYGHCDPNRTSLSEILAENPVTGGALMMNRPLVKIVAQVPEACFMHDWWAALCASCFGVISCVREPLSWYRQHGGNTLGARNTGSMEDLRERFHRKKQVEENYRQMFLQAAAFLRQYGDKLNEEQKSVLKAFLALPGHSPAGRLAGILRYGFHKSSWLQTIAQCFTIPGFPVSQKEML